ncbi:MAG: sialate O-acetylesterase [Planctomycetota bacterium]|nr:sialate O-acetylesterase [Planctomycetota bacterium]
MSYCQSYFAAFIGATTLRSRMICTTFLLLTLITIVCFVQSAVAEVRPNALFSDNAVLQRDRKIPVWGTAAEGEEVKVTLGDKSASTTAKDGKWQVELEPMKAGGPYTLTIEGKNKVEAKNILIGEVWICSGQSNMQWAVNQTADPKQTIAAANYPRIRLVTIPRGGKSKPQDDVAAKWEECSPETVPPFSAVAYHFGVALYKQLDVPIGLISTNVGGTPAQHWTSKEGLASQPELAGFAAEKNASELYNAMIHPLVPYAIRGAIWYQGESNAGQAHRYRTLFPTMIQDWRNVWKQGDFPFLFVQLAPHRKKVDKPGDSTWAELREAQLMTLSKLPNTGMAVIMDVGDEEDIHPKAKQPVGQRLALAARALAYGEKVEHTGPMYESLSVENGRAVLRFRNIGQGLEVRGDKLTGFSIAGEDKVFHNAEAKIEGDTVVVSSPEVKTPVAVRFGWADFPQVNLWNKNGLPASPFRTDNFDGITKGK